MTPSGDFKRRPPGTPLDVASVFLFDKVGVRKSELPWVL